MTDQKRREARDRLREVTSRIAEWSAAHGMSGGAFVPLNEALGWTEDEFRLWSSTQDQCVDIPDRPLRDIDFDPPGGASGHVAFGPDDIRVHSTPFGSRRTVATKPTERQIFERIDACHRTLPPNVALGWTETEYARFRMDNDLIPDRPLPPLGEPANLLPGLHLYPGGVTLVGQTFGAERFSDPESERDRHFTLKREGEGDGVFVEADVGRRAGRVELSLNVALFSFESEIDPEVRFVGSGRTEEDALREAEVRLRWLYDRGMLALHDLRAKLKEGGRG